MSDETVPMPSCMVCGKPAVMLTDRLCAPCFDAAWDAQIDAALPLLLAVLVPAIRFGIWPAVYASLLAFLAYNFYFIEPYYTLSVARPSQVVGLMVFLMISVITAAIAGQAREREMARELLEERLKREVP